MERPRGPRGCPHLVRRVQTAKTQAAHSRNEGRTLRVASVEHRNWNHSPATHPCTHSAVTALGLTVKDNRAGGTGKGRMEEEGFRGSCLCLEPHNRPRLCTRAQPSWVSLEAPGGPAAAGTQSTCCPHCYAHSQSQSGLPHLLTPHLRGSSWLRQGQAPAPRSKRTPLITINLTANLKLFDFEETG